MSEKLPVHRLPLPSKTLQQSLPRLALGDQPSAQRRSTTFATSAPGVWARVNPLWAAWPLRVTKEEILEMGVDVEQGEQVSVEDVLARWDPVEEQVGSANGPVGIAGRENGQNERGNSLRIWSSKHRSELRPELLGISNDTLEQSLPHLEVGDAVAMCSGGRNAEASSSSSKAARDMLVDVLSGRQVLIRPPSSADDSRANDGYGPWSTRYCGHQFGSWAGQLGDGRAISILETTSPDGGRQEIQLKGAGRTPFSRHADGLAVLRSGVREFLGCEAVSALGIPSTRSLALLTAPLPNIPVFREDGAEPPSLLARIAPTFIRIGHFQALNPGEAGRNTRQIFFGGRFHAKEEEGEEEGPLGGQGSLEGLRDLVEWCKDEVMEMRGQSTAEWVKDVVRRNAEMVAKWQVYGWCHGVLNTDNISIVGLTIDFGPYAFMDVWDEGHICNHSDPSGLYSYRNQPSRVLFALDKLVSAVAPLIGYETLNGAAQKGWSESVTANDVKNWEATGLGALQGWEETFWTLERGEERRGWGKRFGLRTCQDSDDREVIYDFLTMLHTHAMDFHTSLRRLSLFRPSTASDPSSLAAFASSLVEAAITSGSSDGRSSAEHDIITWLGRYAKRSSADAEMEAWGHVSFPGAEEDARLYGPQRDVIGSENERDWETTREEGMKRVNPRFVLRQWVLEETIKRLEEAGVEKIEEGRRVLAGVLDMSVRPFYPWGEGAIGSEAEREAARLCGLGQKEMLGFQCSCSS